MDVEWGQSPPKLGGDPSRSEGGAVCSKLARSALLVDFRKALLFLIGALREYHKAPRFAMASPPNLT